MAAAASNRISCNMKSYSKRRCMGLKELPLRCFYQEESIIARGTPSMFVTGQFGPFSLSKQGTCQPSGSHLIKSVFIVDSACSFSLEQELYLIHFHHGCFNRNIGGYNLWFI